MLNLFKKQNQVTSSDVSIVYSNTFHDIGLFLYVSKTLENKGIKREQWHEMGMTHSASAH